MLPRPAERPWAPPLVGAPGHDPMHPVVYRVAAHHADNDDTFTLTLARPSGTPSRPSAPGSSTCSTSSAWARCRSRSAATRPPRGSLVHTIRAVGAVTRALRELAPGDRVGVRGPFGTAWPVDAGATGSDVVARRRRHRPRAAAARALPRARRTASGYGRVVLLYGARTPRRPALPRRARALARPLRRRGRGDGGPRRQASWQRPRRRRARQLIARAPFDPRAHRGHGLRARGDDALRRAELEQRGVAAPGIYVSHGAQHEVRGRALRPLPVRPVVRLQGRAGLPLRPGRAAASACGRCDVARRPAQAEARRVWKFASCDGCQLSLLDCEDELLARGGRRSRSPTSSRRRGRS